MIGKDLTDLFQRSGITNIFDANTHGIQARRIKIESTCQTELFFIQVNEMKLSCGSCHIFVSEDFCNRVQGSHTMPKFKGRLLLKQKCFS